MVKRIASLVACCAFLWAVSAGLFLAFCRFSGIAFSVEPDVRSADQPFPLYLLSAGSALRAQMHNTWLFLAAFAALGVASLLWVMAEKWQLGSKWNKSEAYWMAWFAVSLSSTAILYGLGTNGALARKFARSVTITDVLSVGLALAVPVLLWSRWHRHPPEAEDDQETGKRHSGFVSTRTMLGLNEDQSPGRLIDRTPAPVAVAELKPLTDVLAGPVKQPTEWMERNLHEQSGPVAISRKETSMMETMHIVDPKTETPVPISIDQAAHATPIASFRDQLTALNAGWQRIEETGKQVEEWFRWQQERMVAHLQRNTEAKVHGSPFDFSRDFLEQKMQQVDEEWAAIHRTVREMDQWLEKSNPVKELAEASGTE